MDRSVVGGCLLFVGVFLLIALLATPAKEGFVFNLAMSLLVSGPPILLGSWLIRNFLKAKRETKAALEATQEKEVLLLAERKGGMLTVSQVVAETSLDATHAEVVLQQLAAHGCATIRTSDSGLQVVYEFFDMLPKDQPEQVRILPDRLKE